MTVAESGIIFINEQPELRWVHAIQPTLAVVSETEYLCLFKHGTAIESVDSVLAQSRSSDAGNTWQFEGLLAGTISSGGARYSYFSPHLQKLRDGRLVVVSVRFRRDDPNRRVYNPGTGGCLPPETTCLVSSDSGRSWSEPKLIPIGGRYAYSGGPVIELDDGRWMVVCESWKPFDDPSPAKVRTFALFSSDFGESWGEETTVYEDLEGRRVFWDVPFIRRSDGSLLGIAWTHDLESSRDLDHHRLVSKDHGRSWSVPETTNLAGQYVITRELPDGRLLGVYNLRSGEKPGVYASLSADGGLTWELARQVQVWDALDQTTRGGRRSANFLEDLATFAFGKPDARVIDETHALVAFWATRSCITHIRWCRLDLEA